MIMSTVKFAADKSIWKQSETR